MEEWRYIKNYPNYMVSNLGRVKNIKTEKVLKLRKYKGYARVWLFNDYSNKNYAVHRLVAEAFIPNPDNLPQCNHKNEIRSDNRVENLEWCTHLYNQNYGTRNKRISEKMTNGKLSKPVLQYTLDGEFIREWPSTKEIKRELNYSPTCICKCCNNKKYYKTYKGFIWKWK